MFENLPINIPVGCTVINHWGHDTWQLVHDATGMEFQADLRGAHKITFIHAATNDMSSTTYSVHESQVIKHPNAPLFFTQLRRVEDGDVINSWWYITSDDELMEHLLAMPI